MSAPLIDSAGVSIESQPTLAFREIAKAHRILGNVFHYNTPYYQLGTAEIGGKPFYPLLLFAEALVYQADVEIERAQHGIIPFAGQQPWQKHQALLTSMFQQQNLLTEGVRDEMSNLTTYWELENALMYHGRLSHELVVQALSLRASDIMMIHHLVHQLLPRPYDAQVFIALLAWEILTEIECDLREYPADVAADDYNTYRMFVRLYGDKAPAHMAVEWQRRQDYFDAAVAALPTTKQLVFQSLAPQLHSRRPRPAIPTPLPDHAASNMREAA
jgi:hypothetical protein